MFNRYKSTVRYNKINQYVLNNDNYKEVVNSIIKANENLDKESLKFQEVIGKYPKSKLEKKDKDQVIKLKKHIFNMITCNIEINNNIITVIIDTGAEVSVLTDKALKNINVELNPEEKVEVGSSNGSKDEMQAALVGKVSIGDTNITNLPVLVIDGKQLSLSILGYKLFKVDGILGWDVLSKFDFEIDYRKLELRITQINEENGILNLVKSSFPAMLVTDKWGEIRTFGLDTGARNSWINEKLIKKAELIIRKNKKQKISGVHGKEIKIVNVVKEYEVMLKDTSISFENINTGYTKFLNNYEFDGVLGADILKDNIIRVINSKGIIMLGGDNVI